MSIDSPKSFISKIAEKAKNTNTKKTETKTAEKTAENVNNTTTNTPKKEDVNTNQKTTSSSKETSAFLAEKKKETTKNPFQSSSSADNMEKVLENQDVLGIFAEKETPQANSENNTDNLNNTKALFGTFQVNSVDEFKVLTDNLKMDINIDFDKLSNGAYNEYELDEISQAVTIALEKNELNSENKDLRLNNPEMYGYLNDKYNLGFNVNSENDIDNLTDEQLTLFRQAYATDIQEKNIEATKDSMLSYFKTLGVFDKAYDKVKNIFNSGLTKEDVEKYYEKDLAKNQFMASVVKNGGEISLNDEDTQKQLKDIINYNIENMSLEEVGKYASKAFGIESTDFDKFKANHPEFFNANGERCTDDNGNMVKDDYIKKVFVEELGLNNINFENSNLSYEDAYKIVNATEYNQDLINDIVDSKEAYTTLVQQQQKAVNFEHIIANSSPKEALEYFNTLSEQQNSGESGEELFNKYYAEMFKNYPEKFQGEDISGAKCTGISVKDGYLWQELSYPEGMDMDDEFASEFLYKVTDENGKDKYYKVINLENEKEILSNLNGHDEIYTASHYGSKEDDSYYNNHPLALFYKTNDTIRDNNLYLQNVKDNFDTEYGNGAFDAIMEKYPKMCESAFGKNFLTDKLEAYKKNMDSYATNLSLIMCAGCLAAACCGVTVPMAVGVISTFSDNFINGLNIDTSSLSNAEKQALRKQLLAESFVEGGIFLVGTAVNETIQSSSLTKKIKDILSASSEYAIESGSDTTNLFRTSRLFSV